MRMTGFLLAVASVFLAAQTYSDPPLLVKAVNIIDLNTGSVRRANDVLVTNGRIAQVQTHMSAPHGATQIEGRGKFLIPGLWDMHVHLAGLSADPAWSRDLLLPLRVANGVTGVRDMGGDLEILRRWKKDITEKNILDPEIVAPGAMLDGEFDDRTSWKPETRKKRGSEWPNSRPEARTAKPAKAGWSKARCGRKNSGGNGFPRSA